MRVAVYFRVSPDELDQTISIELQKQTYVERIRRHPDWNCVGCYVDEWGKRTAFQKLMEDARAGKIDRIEAKSIADFIDDMRELFTLSVELKYLDTPVKVHFESEGVTTGTDEWNHCICFLMSFLEASYRATFRQYRVRESKEDTVCRI